MAENSKIQWTDHSVNFWTGCKKVSDGCKYCYMYRDKERYGADPSDVIRVSQQTINKILKVALPGQKIFTCSWSDFFIEEADGWRQWAWAIIRSRPDLVWQILTKRPERITQCLPPDWGEGYNNVWIGVSAENEKEAQKRIPILATIKCKVSFLSIEPFIENFDLRAICAECGFHPGWVIIGGESGNDTGKYLHRPCALKWIEDMVRDCRMMWIPVFVKQMGTYIAKQMGMGRHGGNISEFPEHLKIREFPVL